MIRNMKAIGVAVAAVLALSALTASAAVAAEEHTFNSEVNGAAVTGTQIGEHVFTSQGKEVKCKTATFTGTAAGTATDTQRVHPAYGECTFAGIKTNVTTTGCDYVFDSDTTLSSHEQSTGGSAEHAPVRLDCGHPTSSNRITLDVGPGLCKVTVGDTHGETTVNQEMHGVKFTNAGGAGNQRDVVVDATVATIAYEVHGSFCNLAGVKTGTFTDGTYTGETTVKGSNGGNPVGLFMTTP